jgi:hypothetical protein
MRRYGLAGLALAVLLGGGVRADEKDGDKGEAVKKEWKRVNGTWELVRAVVDGKEQPAPKEKVTVALRDGKYTVKQGGKVVAEGTGKIDPRRHAQVDGRHARDRGEQGEDLPGHLRGQGGRAPGLLRPAGQVPAQGVRVERGQRPQALHLQAGQGPRLTPGGTRPTPDSGLPAWWA